MARRQFEIDDKMGEVYTGGSARATLVMPPGLKLFKPRKDATFRIDVIPYLVGPSVSDFVSGYRFSAPDKWHWNVIYRVHNNVGPDNKSVVCPLATFGKPCPICERRQGLYRQNTKEAREEADSLAPKERQILLVAEWDDRASSRGDVQLWDVSPFCFLKQLQKFIAASDEEDQKARHQFWHPGAGMTLKVSGSEESMGSGGTYGKYSVMDMKPRRAPLSDALLDELAENRQQYDLTAMVRRFTYDSISEMLYGDGGADDDTPPRRSARAVPAGYSEPPGYESAAGDSVPKVRPAAAREPDPFDPDPEAPRPAQRQQARSAGAAYEPAEGDLVRLTFRGAIVTGEVTAVDRDDQTAHVQIQGRDPRPFDWSELTPAGGDSPRASALARDDEPVQTQTKRRPAPVPDEDSPKRRPIPAAVPDPVDDEPAPVQTRRRPAPVPDDDEPVQTAPPPKRRPAPAPEDDDGDLAPPPKKKPK